MAVIHDLTPAMRQFVEIKSKYPDCILFFRMGDFYEMFFDDAIRASQILEITLTSRNKGKADAIPLCGVPYHAASSYISRLIEKGFKVAICEQVEDPRLAKGVVQREVVRVITPGLVVDPECLDARQNNFLAALCRSNGTYGLAFLDISTGEFFVTDSFDEDSFLEEAAGFEFREVLIAGDLSSESRINELIENASFGRVDFIPDDYFNTANALMRIQNYFSTDHLKKLNAEKHPAWVTAAGAILRYVEETQKGHLQHIHEIQWYQSDQVLLIDEIAKQNLELFRTSQDQRKVGSLFHILDKTVTAMGGRRLQGWLSRPLVRVKPIRKRHAAVADLTGQHLLRENIRRLLSQVYDLERLAARVTMGLANGRDLVALKGSLQAISDIIITLEPFTAARLQEIRMGLDSLPEVSRLIDSAIVDDPPLTIREGGIIKEGYDEELDQLIYLTRDGRQWIARLEEKERKRTNISSLKVGFNSVFGYYIEVTKANTALVPDDYIRKQTLVNAERYINEELKEYEATVLQADEKRREREYVLFVDIRGRIASEVRRIQATASCVADLDALVSLAEVAVKYHYCCPEVAEDDVIEIREGRHPVVEHMPIPDGFVPNDILLDRDRSQLLIITGPNMAGKSTFIRQAALIVLMAQMGSFVPASSARIGVVDRIFTRIGASDSIAKGQSTFMVEMNEVARILKGATPRSLIILDEVGRGTSTYDGLSIAWAVAEHLHDAPSLSPRTMFATHYHELTELADTKKGVKNYHIAIREWGDRIIFLRKVVEGGMNRSYGIQVARLAGISSNVLDRAKEILKNLEKGERDAHGMPKIARGSRIDKNEQQLKQLNLFVDEGEAVIQEIRETDLLKMTPLDAMHLIQIWKDKLTVS
jgi:DNA mismatch repair protein MutS